MSATEILKELPKSTEKNNDVAACNQAALDGAIMLDRMEDEDARRQPR